MHTPETPEALAELLRESAAANRTITTGGSFTKDRMSPVARGEVAISTRALNRVLEYEPRDLTISVQAGMLWRDLESLVAKDGMMVPLDPAFAQAGATVGGAIAANSSGPRRRGYGTARDLVIGMKFATLEGQIIQSGGMVVKNVAGLDMAKLMIGSFGTLAAIVSVNFKLIPVPAGRRTILMRHKTLDDAIRTRDGIVQGVLQPVALDLLNPEAAALVGLNASDEGDWCLLAQAAGNAAVLDRYSRDLAGETIGDEIWQAIRELPSTYTTANPQARIVRFSTTLAEVDLPFRSWRGPMLARAASGVVYGYSEKPLALPGGMKAVVELGDALAPWQHPTSDFAVMKKIKTMLDPKDLLNPGRLYGRI